MSQMEATQNKNDEPFVKAEIDNMEVQVGTLNWRDHDISSGSIDITLANGTVIKIKCSTSDISGETITADVKIWNMNDTEIVVFSDKVSKKTTRKELGQWTSINKVVE